MPVLLKASGRWRQNVLNKERKPIKLKTRKFLLTLLVFAFTSVPCFAEGQYGLDAFVAITYLLSFLIYTLVGGILIRILLKAFRLDFPHKKSICYFLAFLGAVIFCSIDSELFVPFFWFES